jgi:hypothetical protein
MVAIKSRKGRKSSWNQRWFKALKVVQIIAGALIAFFASFREGALRYVTGIFGVVVVILESLQGLYEFQHYWIQYRTISEGLKREKYLWLGKAARTLLRSVPTRSWPSGSKHCFLRNMPLGWRSRNRLPRPGLRGQSAPAVE